MKRKIIWVALICVAVLLASIGSVGAYMRKQTEVVENIFVPASVACEVVETFTNDIKTRIEVKNTGTVPAYLRLRLVTYCIDSHGDILYGDPPNLSFNYDEDKWDLIDEIYYYREPVEPGEKTADLLAGSSVIPLRDEGEGDNRKRQVVEVFAEAIQSEPLDAMKESWGVIVTDGIITKLTN